MKNIYILLLGLVFISTSLDGQVANKIFGDINSKPFSPKFALAKGEILFTVDTATIIQKKTHIRLIKQNDDTLYVVTNNSSPLLSPGATDLPFILIGGDYQTKLTFSDWDAQLLTIPIKVRPALNSAPLEFVGEVSLGSYIGYQVGSTTIGAVNQSTIAHTAMLFAAPSLIRIDPEQAATDMTNNTLGFSLGLGYLFNLNQYQIGLVSGIDYIGGQISKSWIYQGKPWLSFTIGIAFNETGK